MYELEWDTVAHESQPVDYELSVYCEVPSLEEYSGMKYEVYGYYENTDQHQFVMDNHIGKRAIDKIIYPSIMHPGCTAIMSSERLYDIIRFHVKQNIDYRYADVTSDYRFCFTVKKRVIGVGEYDTVKRADNKRDPALKKCDLVEVFEMTHNREKHKGYTAIPEMSAKNNKALKRKVDKYLKELMEHINTPVIVCKCCNGTGVETQIERFDHPPKESK